MVIIDKPAIGSWKTAKIKDNIVNCPIKLSKFQIANFIQLIFEI